MGLPWIALLPGKARMDLFLDSQHVFGEPVNKLIDLKSEKSKVDVGRQADYYLENGLMVFTEAYHLKRGYCCQSDCRHCPYGFKASKNKSKK